MAPKIDQMTPKGRQIAFQIRSEGLLGTILFDLGWILGRVFDLGESAEASGLWRVDPHPPRSLR